MPANGLYDHPAATRLADPNFCWGPNEPSNPPPMVMSQLLLASSQAQTRGMDVVSGRLVPLRIRAAVLTSSGRRSLNQVPTPQFATLVCIETFAQRSMSFVVFVWNRLNAGFCMRVSLSLLNLRFWTSCSFSSSGVVN